MCFVVDVSIYISNIHSVANILLSTIKSNLTCEEIFFTSIDDRKYYYKINKLQKKKKCCCNVHIF